MNNTNRRVQRYVSKEFARLLDEIKITRIKLGQEMLKPLADWRITLAMLRHPQMQIIKEAIINAELK